MNKMIYSITPINYMECKYCGQSWKCDVEMDIYVKKSNFFLSHISHWMPFKRFIMCKTGMQTNQPDE